MPSLHVFGCISFNILRPTTQQTMNQILDYSRQVANLWILRKPRELYRRGSQTPLVTAKCEVTGGNAPQSSASNGNRNSKDATILESATRRSPDSLSRLRSPRTCDYPPVVWTRQANAYIRASWPKPGSSSAPRRALLLGPHPCPLCPSVHPSSLPSSPGPHSPKLC